MALFDGPTSGARAKTAKERNKYCRYATGLHAHKSARDLYISLPLYTHALLLLEPPFTRHECMSHQKRCLPKVSLLLYTWWSPVYTFIELHIKHTELGLS